MAQAGFRIDNNVEQWAEHTQDGPAHARMPVAFESLTTKELNAELEKGMDDIRSGRVYAEDSVFEEMRRLYGV
jgi:hypothetical protein